MSIPNYFENKEPPIICYKYNKPIRNTIFNFNKLVAYLDIETKDSGFMREQYSKFCSQHAGHINMGNLKKKYFRLKNPFSLLFQKVQTIDSLLRLIVINVE